MEDFIFKYGSKKNPKARRILSYDKWRESFISNDSSIHWKEGRSAQSLADDFMLTNKWGRELLVQLVEQVTGNEIEGKIEAYIEHESEIEGFRGKARMQDLAAFGKLRSNSICAKI
jgi:hypothetical protein